MSLNLSIPPSQSVFILILDDEVLNIWVSFPEDLYGIIAWRHVRQSVCNEDQKSTPKLTRTSRNHNMRHVGKENSAFQLQPRLASETDSRLRLSFLFVHVYILAAEEYAFEEIDVILKSNGQPILAKPLKTRWDILPPSLDPYPLHRL